MITRIAHGAYTPELSPVVETRVARLMALSEEGSLAEQS